MPKTFAEKILAAYAGKKKVVPGEIVFVEPDIYLSHDNAAAIIKKFKDIGVSQIKYSDRVVIILDHCVPAANDKHAQNHKDIREFVKEQRIVNFFDINVGICHQVLAEEGYIQPGKLIVGSDSHTPMAGALGSFAVGIGRTEIASLWAIGKLWLKVPESIKIVVSGKFPQNVYPKDLALKIIGDIGADGALYKSVEFHGEQIEKMDIGGRMTLCNLAAEMGAKNGYCVPNKKTWEWLKKVQSSKFKSQNDIKTFQPEADPPLVEKQENNKTIKQENMKANGQNSLATRHSLLITSFNSLTRNKLINNIITSNQQLATNNFFIPDSNAYYEQILEYDVSKLEPQIACPHTVDNVKTVKEVVGTKIQQALIGTCANGRLEDIEIAAKILKGKKVHQEVRLLVFPASWKIYQEAMAKGYLKNIIEAGGVIMNPGCGPCLGAHEGILADGEVCISTANRNFKGRMGNKNAEVYLASPATVAASAIEGEIT